MLIYRVEHPANCRGPFRGGRYSDFTDEDTERFIKAVKGQKGDGADDTKCPSPHQELDRAMKAGDHDVLDQYERICSRGAKSINGFAPEQDPKEMVFGCANEEQLNNWFPPEACEVVRRYGFKLSLYQVPDDKALKLKTQAGFLREDGKLIGRTSI